MARSPLLDVHHSLAYVARAISVGVAFVIIVNGTAVAADEATLATPTSHTLGGSNTISDSRRKMLIPRVQREPPPAKISCQTKLIIMIASDVRQRWKREAQRNSWAMRFSDIPPTDVRYFFVVGQIWEAIPPSLTAESDEYKDIIVAPVNDLDFSTYTKKMVFGMQAATKNCNFNYLLKVAEFAFVNVFNIRAWLARLPSTGVYRGRVIKTASPIRHPASAWYIPWELYNRPTYPPYTEHVYLLSYDIVAKIVQMKDFYLSIYFDDVALGVWLSDHDIHPEHDTAISAKYDCVAPVIIELSLDKLRLFGENMRDRSNHQHCYT